MPGSPADALDRLDRALSRPAPGRVRLVTVTGASNVTGEIWPYAEMARIAHRHRARILVDAAELAPHRRVDMAADGIDYLALSAEDCDRLVAAIGEIATHGARRTYSSAPDGTDCRPDPDPRPRPDLSFMA